MLPGASSIGVVDLLDGDSPDIEIPRLLAVCNQSQSSRRSPVAPMSAVFPSELRCQYQAY